MNQIPNPESHITFPDGTVVTAEIADTDEARARGLMFRDSLGEREGMLFPFEVPRRYGFWMKDVRVPLDIIWLDDRNRVVWIVESAPPCEAEPCPMYLPEAKAVSVLEVQGGFVRRHGVAPGDRLTINRLPSSCASRTPTPGRC